MACDLCGKDGSTTKTRIEGVVYDACSDCAGLGTDATKAQPKRSSSGSRSSSSAKSSSRSSGSYRSSENTYVRSDAGTLLRKKRESTGKDQDEFAQQLNVKESLLHAWETGERTPTVEMARKLEKRLHINLTETGSRSGGDAVEYLSGKDSGSGGMTIGDMLKKE